jgi:hypothetical protein
VITLFIIPHKIGHFYFVLGIFNKLFFVEQWGLIPVSIANETWRHGIAYNRFGVFAELMMPTYTTTTLFLTTEGIFT